MATATNIVLADAQATPVNHTFVPIGKDEKETFWFLDQSQSNEIGFWRIGVDIAKPKPARMGENSQNRVSRVKVTLSEPVLETLSANAAGYVPAPTVAYIPRTIIEFVLPERSSLQNRKDLRKMSNLLLNDANIISVVENLQYLSQ